MTARSEFANHEEYLSRAIGIASMHNGFTDGCRVLILIQRHSDGGNTNNSKLRAYISRSTDEWAEALAKLLQERDCYPHLPLRIYQTLNARDIDKGIRHFKYAMLDADFYDEESRQWFYLDVRNRIVSALMKPPCKAQSNFLFDCDTQDNAVLDGFIADLSNYTEIIHQYPTKHGRHIITKPVNPNSVKCPENIELKTDAMMLLVY